jgi:hypothetical protein
MTTEENFARLFNLVVSLAETTAKNTEDINRLEASVQGLVRVSTEHQDTLRLYQQRYEQDQQRYEQDQQRFNALLTSFDAVLARIDRQSDEIRGLQTENRRILDHLFNNEEGSQP